MIKKLLLAGLVLPAISFAQTSVVSDNFDSYTVSGTVAAQSGGIWETWSGTTPEDAFVSDSVSVSGANSMLVYQTGDGAFLHDMVMNFPGFYSTGRYEVKMQYFVPSGKGAYFNLGSVWASGGAGYEYGIDVFFNADGSGGIDASDGSPFVYNQDEWLDLSVIIDLDLSTVEFSIGGTSIYSGAWALSGFGVLDVFGLGYTDGTGAANGAGYFFVDDVELLDWTGVGVEESLLNPAISIVPNPSTGNFAINYQDLNNNSAKIQVVDILGSVVYNSEESFIGNGSVSLNLDLNDGVYFVTVGEGKNKITKRVLVKK